MVSHGIFKHLYRLFVPKESKNGSRNSEDTSGHVPGPPSLQGYIPMYGADGGIEGYVRATGNVPNSVQQVGKSFVKQEIKAALPVDPVSANQVRYVRTAEGHFIPVSTPAVTANVPVVTSTKQWDGWPDGVFHHDFTHEEAAQTNNLQINWATKASGGDRGGDELSSTWERGKKLTRKCLGVIVCNNVSCNVVICPKTTAPAFNLQLQESCICSAQLLHQPCETSCISWKWKGGMHLFHDGYHTHSCPGRILHPLPNEKQQFESVVKAYPNTGPLGLIVGVPGVAGPGKSIADISDVYLNADRVGKERLKIKKEAETGGQTFLAGFATFMSEHPGFVINAVIGIVTVISVQTDLMRWNLVKDSLEEEPVNGMVNDATHDWWAEHGALLMVSSTYCPFLFCWVPGLFSYTNGATAEHFKTHFLGVFQCIALEADERYTPMSDEMFAGVMDFSDAEKNGFILAFIEFWSLREDDHRTKAQLKVDAEKLLKGCQEHFRAGVTRISRISGVVKPELKDAFVARALSLLHAPDTAEFISRCDLLVRDFPKLQNWMEWWTRPSHASMLFASERTMDIALWNALPKTNNAEESMHWKLYSACGRKHAFLPGLKALFAFAAYYERLYMGSNGGKIIRHGRPQRWWVTAQNIGFTKPSRAPGREELKRKHNDGRPPDTSAELLRPAKKARLEITFGPPSYKWANNSCWLDSSLEILFLCAMQRPAEFLSMFKAIPATSGLHTLYLAMQERMGTDLATDDSLVTHAQTEQRESIRKMLLDNRAIDSLDEMSSVMGWLCHIIRNESLPAGYPVISYFYAWTIRVHRCTGSQKIGGPHFELVQPIRVQDFQVNNRVHKEHSGSIENYFKKRLDIAEAPVKATRCWRVKDNECLCPGNRFDTTSMIISLPIILAIEVSEDSSRLDVIQDTWNFPAVLHPHTKAAAKKGIVYDLIGLVLVKKLPVPHFIVRSASIDRKTIYTYDGMLHNGFPVVEKGATFKTHVSGAISESYLPSGFSVYQAYYQLRGGREAQKMFYDIRTEALARRYNLKFDILSHLASGPPSVTFQPSELKTLHKLEPEDRARWVTRTNTSWSFEYATSTYAWKKKHTKHAVTQVSDEEANGEEEVASEEANSEDEAGSTCSDNNKDLEDDGQHEDGPVTPVKPLAQSPNTDLQEHTLHEVSPASSLPDSLFGINCRCGMSGNGNIHYLEHDGPVIQCSECSDWSHIACQRNGRALHLTLKDSFVCDFCDYMTPIMSMRMTRSDKKPTRASQRKAMADCTMIKKPLAARLWAGRGALVCVGEFWYPVRLIQKKDDEHWMVRWWRGCQFNAPGVVPDTITEVETQEIVDSLWNNQSLRRKTRLGLWTHSWETPTPDDMLSDPSSVPYTNAIHDALNGLRAILEQMVFNPTDVDSSMVPVMKWLEKNKKNILHEVVPFSGSLTLIERAQILNWFERNVSKEKKNRHLWMELAPMAHAYTLYLATLVRNIDLEKRSTALEEPLTEQAILEKAWEAQVAGTPSVLADIDVDRECLEILEEEMFEKSLRAGIAGNWQWGLDEGDNQQANVYAGAPESWNHGDRPGDEEEMQPGPNFRTIERPSPPVDTRPRPKPRPIKKRTHKTQ